MDFEFAFLDWIQSNLRSDFWDSFFIGVTTLGDAGIIWIILSIVGAFFKKWRKPAFTLMAALALCLIFGNLILKPLIARERPFMFSPEILLLIDTPSDFSFPSGHTYPAFAALAVTFIYHMKWYIKLPTAILACLIAFSRMYLYVHYPTDILGGMILGTICAVLGFFIIKWLYKRFDKSGIEAKD